MIFLDKGEKFEVDKGEKFEVEFEFESKLKKFKVGYASDSDDYV